MNRLVRRGLVVAASMVLLIPVSACSSKDAGSTGTAVDVPGVTDTEILVGTHQPLTGPVSAGYSKIAPATKAYFDFVNANGGVYGRKISYKIVDDGYNPATTQSVVRELVQQDKVFAILNGLGTPTHTGVLDFLKQNEVPDLFVASGSTSWNQPTKYPGTFGFAPDYTVEGKILANYAKTTYPDKKVCFFGQDDDFGRDSRAGVETVLGSGGLVAKETYVPTNTNVSPQVGGLQAAGCEVVILATTTPFTALLIGAGARIGFRPQYLVSASGRDYTTLASVLGENKGLLEGMIGTGYLPEALDSTDPWIVLFKQINKDYNGNAPFDNNIVYGMSVGYLFVQVLLKAGKNITREGLIRAVEAGGYKGPGATPLQYTPKSHTGYNGVRLNRISGGTQAYFGSVYQTDDAAGPVTVYGDKQAAPPASGIPTV